MSVLLATLLLAADGAERMVYHCRNAADETRFALTYERRGSRLRDVTVGHFGLPRLGDDLQTRWRGEMVAGEAVFRVAQDRSGSRLTGVMRLSPVAGRDEQFLLTWYSTMGGAHVVLEEEERSAGCTLIRFEQANPSS